MSEENIEELLNTQIAGGVIISALKQWKPIQSVSVALLVVQLCIMFQISNTTFLIKLLFGSGVVIFLLLQVFLIRLYFDKLLFERIYEYQDIGNDSKIFDKVMKHVVCSKIKSRTMESRWRGTKHLIITTFVLLTVQAIIICMSLNFM